MNVLATVLLVHPYELHVLALKAFIDVIKKVLDVYFQC